MRRQPTQEDYQKKVDKAKKLILKEIRQHFNGGKSPPKNRPYWTSAFLKVVWFGEGNTNGWKSKMRVLQADGKTIGIQTNFEIDGYIHEIGDLKDIVFADNKWYGFRITVHPNGKYEVDLDHDPNCCNDPHWYKS